MYDELTAEDIKKMEEEIEYRKLVVRKKALEAVKEARAHGDLSENFEYYAAKREKNKKHQNRFKTYCKKKRIGTIYRRTDFISLILSEKGRTLNNSSLFSGYPAK